MRSTPRCARLKGMSADNHDMNYSAETYVVAGGRPAHEHDASVNPRLF